MKKAKAIELLGGTVALAAEAICTSYNAVHKWPDELPPRIADRVIAAIARKHLPSELIGGQPGQGAPAARSPSSDVTVSHGPHCEPAASPRP